MIIHSVNSCTMCIHDCVLSCHVNIHEYCSILSLIPHASLVQ